MQTTTAAERLRTAIDLDAETSDTTRIDAFLAWLAEDEIAPWVTGRLWDLAAFMVASGRGIVRTMPRDDSLSPVLYAALEQARDNWSKDTWRRAQAAEHLIGGNRRTEATTGPAGNFKQGLDVIHNALPMVGATPEKQAAVLRIMAGIVEGEIAEEHFKAELDKRQHAERYGAAVEALPEPATSPAEPWVRRPADFEDEIPIGSIGGNPVTGLLMWVERPGEARVYGVKAELGGLEVSFYPGEAEGNGGTDVIEFGDEGIDSRGEIRLSDLGTLIELHQSGHLPELIAIGRRFCARDVQAELLPFEPRRKAA